MIKRWSFSLVGVCVVLVWASVVAATPKQASSELANKLDEIVNRLADTGATVTARFITLPDRKELYGKDVDVPFTPASNMKVPVSATGLDLFGAEHSFKTYLAVDGDDLWVIGTGDPGIGDPRLARRRGETVVTVFDRWADALLKRGVREIKGNLYYYDDAFDDELVHSSWGGSVLHWYGAPVAGLIFNDNCVDITIKPTEAGKPVSYEVVPPVAGIDVINECVTGESHSPTIVKLRGGNIYKIGGTCSKVAELMSKPVDDPGRFFSDALRMHLASRGIIVQKNIEEAYQPLGGSIPPPAKNLVATYETSMKDVLGRINTNSQNLFAEAMCKLAGQEFAAMHGRKVRGSWADGSKAVHAFCRKNGIDDKALVVADGSGLSHLNKLTSRLLTDLFAVMHAGADAELFVDSLAKGGVNGTLEKRFAGLDGHVFAKTGHINGVRSLSGYVKTKRGQWLAFSIIYNNIPGSMKPYEDLQDEAVKLLVEWRGEE